MSSDEDAASSKKRKLQRACDYCRQKKSAYAIAQLWANFADVWLYSQMYGDIGLILLLLLGISRGSLVGDGPQKVGGRCSRCITRNIECTYYDAMQVSNTGYCISDPYLTLNRKPHTLGGVH